MMSFSALNFMRAQLSENGTEGVLIRYFGLAACLTGYAAKSLERLRTYGAGGVAAHEYRVPGFTLDISGRVPRLSGHVSVSVSNVISLIDLWPKKKRWMNTGRRFCANLWTSQYDLRWRICCHYGVTPPLPRNRFSSN